MRRFLIRTIPCLGLCVGLLAVAVPEAVSQQSAATDVNRREVDGSTPLQWAVYDDDVAEVRRLLKAGANVPSRITTARPRWGSPPKSETPRSSSCCWKPAPTPTRPTSMDKPRCWRSREPVMWKRQICW